MSETSYEKYLAIKGRLIYRNLGGSMLPLIKQHRDLFVVKKKPFVKCKKYDVVLYKQGSNCFLHRIIDVNDNYYVVRGDNCRKKYNITDEDIVGIMASFIRNGKEYSVDSVFYKFYCVLWCRLYFLRVFYRIFYRK